MDSDNRTVVGLDQDLVLIFQVAWRGNGTTWAKFLSAVITGSVGIRVISNVITLLALAMPVALRRSKEHLLMSYISLYDAIDGCWYFCMVGLDYGIRRRIDCFWTLRHSLWFLIGGQTSTGMLAMVSLDRILCIKFPVWYWKQTYMLSHKLAGAILFWTICSGGYMSSIPFTRPDELVPYCFTSHTFQEAFSYDGIVRRAFLIAHIVLYSIVILLYRSKRMKVDDVSVANRLILKQQNKVQRRLTITMGISAVITLLAHILPLSLWHWLRGALPSQQQYPGYVLFAIVSWSSIANLFLFTARHKEVKVALVALIKRQHLPPTLQEWQAWKLAMDQARREAQSTVHEASRAPMEEALAGHSVMMTAVTKF